MSAVINEQVFRSVLSKWSHYWWPQSPPVCCQYQWWLPGATLQYKGILCCDSGGQVRTRCLGEHTALSTTVAWTADLKEGSSPELEHSGSLCAGCLWLEPAVVVSELTFLHWERDVGAGNRVCVTTQWSSSATSHWSVSVTWSAWMVIQICIKHIHGTISRQLSSKRQSGDDYMSVNPNFHHLTQLQTH